MWTENTSRVGRLFRLCAGGLMIFLLILFTFSAGFFTGNIGAGKSRRPVEIADTSTILRQVQGLQQLVTVSYHLERVVAVTDPGLLGDEKLILIAHGVVKAGLDLSKIRPQDVHTQVSSGEVTLVLPAAKILDVYLDERRTQVFMHDKPFFRSLNKDLDQLARRDVLAQIRSAAQELGIQQDAKERAEMQIRKMLEALGAKKVVIKFTD